MGMSDLNERLNQLEQGALNLLFPRKCPLLQSAHRRQGPDLRRLRKDPALHRGPGPAAGVRAPGGCAALL